MLFCPSDVIVLEGWTCMVVILPVLFPPLI